MLEVELDEKDARSDHSECISIFFLLLFSQGQHPPVRTQFSFRDVLSIGNGSYNERNPSRNRLMTSSLSDLTYVLPPMSSAAWFVITRGPTVRNGTQNCVSSQMIYPHSKRIRHPQLYPRCFRDTEAPCSRMLEICPKYTTFIPFSDFRIV